MDWDGGKEDLHHLSQRIQNWTLTLPEFVHADYSIHSKRADHTTTASRRKKNVGYPSLHTHSQCYPNKSQDLLTLRVFKPCMKHPPPPLPKKPTTNITFLWVSHLSSARRVNYHTSGCEGRNAASQKQGRGVWGRKGAGVLDSSSTRKALVLAKEQKLGQVRANQKHIAAHRRLRLGI